MISGKLQIVILLAVLIYFVVLFYLFRSKSLSLKYSLLWLFSGILLLVIALFPELLAWFTDLVGIQTPTNALFAVVLFCILLILISLTAIVSRQTDRIKNLTQSLALLEMRVRELEKRPDQSQDVNA